MVFLPDESRSLPPPPLLNKGSVWLGPAGSWERWGQFLSLPAAGIHRQILLATVGCFVGYHLVKRAEYVHAKVDRELFEYIRHHPRDF
ncbi:NDUC2 dehydrogenase, partial [Ploceus nigricollis]|nr:NDUC2 dehydrogenase [Ploceus nigricollis]